MMKPLQKTHPFPVAKSASASIASFFAQPEEAKGRMVGREEGWKEREREGEVDVEGAMVVED